MDRAETAGYETEIAGGIRARIEAGISGEGGVLRLFRRGV